MKNLIILSIAIVGFAFGSSAQERANVSGHKLHHHVPVSGMRSKAHVQHGQQNNNRPDIKMRPERKEIHHECSRSQSPANKH